MGTRTESGVVEERESDLSERFALGAEGRALDSFIRELGRREGKRPTLPSFLTHLLPLSHRHIFIGGKVRQ